MNAMLLLAQVAPALTDSIAGANPVLTPVAGPDEFMEHGYQGWLDYDRSWTAVHSLLLHLVRTQLCDQESRQRGPDVHG